MPKFPRLDPESIFAFDQASPIPMSLPEKARLFVREVRRQRAEFAARGLPLVPAPTREQLVALALWAHRKEQEGRTAGLGEGEVGGAAQGAGTGAAIGGTVGGGWGAAIGAVVGGVAGAFVGRKKAKEQAKTAKQAEAAAKTGLKAATVQARGQTQSASLLLQAEKVKARAAGKLPAWGWTAIVIGGVALLGGTIFYVMKE